MAALSDLSLGAEAMTDTSLNHQINAINSALRSYRYDQITGAKLRELILRVVPGFDIREAVEMPIGPALSTFANKYLSDGICQAGFRGQDILFEISGRKSSQSESLRLMTDPRLWKTFASFRSEFQISLDDDTKMVVERKGDSLTPPAKVIRSVERSELDAIQQQFRESLEDDDLTRLDAVVDGATNYGTWIKRLTELGGDLARQWSSFRISRMKELFEARLQDIGVIESERELLISQLGESQTSGYLQRRSNLRKQRIAAEMRPQRSISESDADGSLEKSSVELARQIAKAAIDEMNYSALRELKVPLGAVLDAKFRVE